MLVAASLKSLPTLSVAQAWLAIRNCGLQGVEVDLATARRSRDELQRFMNDGPPITTLDATSLDPGSEGWIGEVTAALDDAAALGAAIMIIPAGDDLADQELRQRLIQQHRRAADLAAEREVVLAWDTLPGLCADAREMQRAIEEVGHPALRLNFDMGRYLAQNPWSSGEVGLQRVFSHLASVRLTNFTVGMTPAEHPALGQGGDVDFARACQFLGGKQIRGPCTIAFQPATRRPPTAAQCEAWLWESVEHLRGCGWFE
jgi:hypothetical protein